MKQFRNILFVSNGLEQDAAALDEAIALALANKANLSILITCPPFNAQYLAYQNAYERFLLDNMEQKLAKTRASLHKIAIPIEIEWGETPSIVITQRVIRAAHDLVVKEVEHNEQEPGFKALDMALLRKCPCELFLYHASKPVKDLHIAVAIDPRDEDAAVHGLAVRLLQLANDLQKHYHGRLSIVACSDFVVEDFLRRSVFVDLSTDEIDKMVLDERESQFQLLNQLVQEAGLHEVPQVHHLHGTPVELIPSFVETEAVGILLMGTVARTGIAGFIMGNTAENILQKLTCSLWAIKPQGFISPVKP